MNEEMIMNEEMETTEMVPVEDVAEEVTSSNGILGKVLIGVGTLVVGGIALYKNRDKIKQKRIEKLIVKLKKEGYEVYSQDELVAMEESYDDSDVCEEDTAEE